jgi:hypothetical protein
VIDVNQNLQEIQRLGNAIS